MCIEGRVAHLQDAYGLEKLVSEECCRWYGVDNPDMAFRIVHPLPFPLENVGAPNLNPRCFYTWLVEK